MSGFEFRNNIALTITVCIALFKVIDELQRKRLHQSRATVFRWKGQISARVAKCPCHSFVIIQWLVAGTFHMGEVSMPRGGHCSGADFTNSRNPGGTEHTQTLCIRLFFSPMHERVPG